MLSKIRLAFTSSSSSSSNNSDYASSSPTTSNTTNKRARSTTIPAPSNSTILTSPPPVLDISTSITASPLSSSPASRSTTIIPIEPSPSPHSILRDESQTSASTSTSTSNSSSSNTPSTSTSSSVSSQLNAILVTPSIQTSSSSSPGKYSDYTNTPQITPRSANFPTAPFSTPSTPAPQTPPRVMVSNNGNGGRYTHSPHHVPHHQSPHLSYQASPYHSNTSSLNNSPATTIEQMKENIPSTTTMNNIRKKTKSTATLPSWIISSFSSSSSSSSPSSSPKESKKETPSPRQQQLQQHQQQQQRDKSNSTEFKQNNNQQSKHNSHSNYLLPSNMPPSSGSIAFPTRAVETSKSTLSGRRGSLPLSSLGVDNLALNRDRPRSPSMLSNSYDTSPNSLLSSSVSSGLYYPPPASAPSVSRLQEQSLSVQQQQQQQYKHQSQQLQPSQHQYQQAQPYPANNHQQQQQQSPSTPNRIDRPSPSPKAPSPLSTTTSSSYQIIADDNSQSPICTPTTPSFVNSPCSTSESPAKPARRKSILGKRRNFTEVWNNSSMNPSNSSSNNKQDDLNSSTSGQSTKKKGMKGHKSKNSSSSKQSGDYSSLLAASKKVFSKSVDDLTSFTKNSLLSSPNNNAINYSRPRKSVDERRNSIYPSSSSPLNGYISQPYGFADMQNASGNAVLGMSIGRGGGGGDNGDVEEELELSSGSSASLAHSPMPSDESTHSMPIYPIPQNVPLKGGNRSGSAQSKHHSSVHHHIFKVPKLPSIVGGKHGLASKKEGKQNHHRKAASSTSTAQVQLPPSTSLPGGLCIESTASILASSMDDSNVPPETPKRSPSSSTHNAGGSKGINSSSNAKKRKSIDARSVRSDSGVLLGSSPGLAPPFTLSPTTSSRRAPSPTFLSHTSGSPNSASPSSSAATSPFPMRPPLISKKSSGSASVSSVKSTNTARMPSFGSPKASSPLALSSPVDSSSNTFASGRQRSSQIILIEGLLQRKTDHRSHIKASSWSFPFSSSSGSMFSSNSSSTSQAVKGTDGSPVTTKQRPSPGRTNSEPPLREIDLSKGWKPFYAILRGTNLYLYKLSGDLNWQSKTCFSNYSTSRSIPSSTATSLSTSSNPMPSMYMPSTPLQHTSDLDEDRIKGSISNLNKAAYLLPIANSTIRTIHSATRGDVFELLTEEGEVAILQTSNKAEADRWMQVISSTGLTIANKRASYLETIGALHIGVDADQRRGTQPDTIPERNSESHDRSFATSTPASEARKNAGKVFGVPLEEIIQREGGKIPKIIDMLFKEVEMKGLLETGIYRVPGENRVMQAMQAKLNAGQELDFNSNPSFSDPHNLASLTKLWLRELPEIISPTFYSAFIQANNIEGYEDRLCGIRDLVWSLPATSFHLLDRLCEHLHLIAEHELENQMHASNLAIVFAPTILRPPDGVDSYGILMSNLGKAAKLVSSLIVQHNWIFSGQEAEEEADVEQTGETGKTPEETAPIPVTEQPTVSVNTTIAREDTTKDTLTLSDNLNTAPEVSSEGSTVQLLSDDIDKSA